MSRILIYIKNNSKKDFMCIDTVGDGREEFGTQLDIIWHSYIKWVTDTNMLMYVNTVVLYLQRYTYYAHCNISV